MDSIFSVVVLFAASVVSIGPFPLAIVGSGAEVVSVISVMVVGAVVVLGVWLLFDLLLHPDNAYIRRMADNNRRMFFFMVVPPVIFLVCR